MRKLSIADVKASEILSVEEKKNVVGGALFICHHGGGTQDKMEPIETYFCSDIQDCYNKAPEGASVSCYNSGL